MRGSGKLKRRAGFTLVELLVVILIIMMLVGILAPSVMSAIKLAYAARTRTRISELDRGCESYFVDQARRFFPGQKEPSQLTGSSPAGLYTGSQVLAAELFGYTYAEIPATPTANPRFATCTVDRNNHRKSDLFDPRQVDTNYASSARPNSISDRFGVKPMAILYFPSRKTVTDVGQYVEADNSAYLVPGGSFDGWTGGSFGAFIKNPVQAGNVPYQAGRFLFLGAGMDRKYGTSDDLKNW